MNTHKHSHSQELTHSLTHTHIHTFPFTLFFFHRDLSSHNNSKQNKHCHWWRAWLARRGMPRVTSGENEQEQVQGAGGRDSATNTNHLLLGSEATTHDNIN